MKHLLKYILQFLLLTMLLFSLQDNLNAQITVLNSGLIAEKNEYQTEPYKSRFFRVRGVADLQVNMPSGDIEVYYNPQIDGIQVDLYVTRGFSLWSGTRSLDTYRIIMQQRGNQIIASVEDTRPGRSSGRGNIEFGMVVQVPVEISTNLRTLTGHISLDGVKGNQFLQNQTGNVTVKNSVGDIRVVTATGNVTLENLDGNIFAKSVSGQMHIVDTEGEIRLRTIAGDIKAENLSGTLVSASTSGSIDAVFREVAIGISMETISGNINLSIPSTAGYVIHGQAMRFDFDELNQSSIIRRNVSSREANIVIREGNVPVNLSTITGQIKVRESNQ